MALAIEDNFESYSVGSINTLNGGSGWSGTWAEVGSNCDIESSVVNTGTRAAQDTDGLSGAVRAWSAESAGVFYVSIRAGVFANSGAFYLKSGASGILFVSCRATGPAIGYYNGSVYATLVAGVVNTWYRIGIEWDNTNQANKWRLNVDGGTWTSWANSGATFSSLDTIGFNGSGDASYDVWFDDISISYSPPPTTSIKSINGLAYASIKSVNGLAIASVKNFNGLA
jgi:hypothetical protein